MLTFSELKEFLDEKHDFYNQPVFIESDPIQVAHRFSQKEDIEIIAFLTTQIAWGNRKMIIKSAEKLVDILQHSPYDFILNASEKEFKRTDEFIHRTFNGNDLKYFLRAFQYIYKNKQGLETVFSSGFKQTKSVYSSLTGFRNIFFELPHPARTEKHIANVLKNSSAKRLNMFLMWMVRKDKRGVHFGLWNSIPVAQLLIPLDVHVGNTARMLGLLTRKQNDLKAVIELTEKLKKFDAADPVKYDFALFGTGVFEGFGRK
jgi:uncharacterized protein (TIGR02757 family)